MKSIGNGRLLSADRLCSRVSFAARQSALLSRRQPELGFKRLPWTQKASRGVARAIHTRPTKSLRSRQTQILSTTSEERPAVDILEPESLRVIWDHEDDLNFPTARTGDDSRHNFFSHLRLMLLHNEPSAQDVWLFMRRDPWWRSWRSEQGAWHLNTRERSLLSEVLHVVIRQSFRLDASREESRMGRIPINQFTFQKGSSIPRVLIKEFRRRNLMHEDDWAIALVALSRSLWDAQNPDLCGTISDKAVLLFDTNLLLNELLLVWKIYFRHYQTHKNSEEDGGRIWTFLRSHPAATGGIPTELDYKARFLAFLPSWKPGRSISADHQILCSSLMTLTAIAKWLHLKGVLHEEVPASGSASPSDIARASIWSIENLSVMSENELSFLYIMTHAANSEGANYTILRLALAQLGLPVASTAALIDYLRTFSSSEGLSLLTQEIYHTSPEGRSKNIWCFAGPSRVVHTLLPIFQQPRTLEISQTAWDICLALRPKYFKYSLDLASIVYKTFLQLDNANLAGEVLEAFPEIRRSKRLWIEGLTFHYRRGDLSAFEEVWRSSRPDNSFVPEEIWRLRLALYAQANEFRGFRRVFDDLCVSAQEKKTCLTTLTCNMTIERLLENDFEKDAHEIYQMLSKHPEVAPDESTYRFFFNHSLKAREFNLSGAQIWLGRMSQAGFEVTAKDCASCFIHQVQTWPLSSRWADEKEIFAAIKSSIFCSDYKGKVATKASQGGRQDDRWMGVCLAILNMIKVEIEQSQRVRLAVILMDYRMRKVHRRNLLSQNAFHRDVAKFSEVIHQVIRSSSRRDQLALLSGDMYQPPSKNSTLKYENFLFVRTVWGPKFIQQYLLQLGIDEYSDAILSISWRGFHAFNQQRLFDAGIVDVSVRGRILHEVGKLRDEAALYAEEVAHMRQEKERDGGYSISASPGASDRDRLLFPKQLSAKWNGIDTRTISLAAAPLSATPTTRAERRRTRIREWRTKILSDDKKKAANYKQRGPEIELISSEPDDAPGEMGTAVYRNASPEPPKDT